MDPQEIDEKVFFMWPDMEVQAWANMTAHDIIACNRLRSGATPDALLARVGEFDASEWLGALKEVRAWDQGYRPGIGLEKCMVATRDHFRRKKLAHVSPDPARHMDNVFTVVGFTEAKGLAQLKSTIEYVDEGIARAFEGPSPFREALKLAAQKRELAALADCLGNRLDAMEDAPFADISASKPFPHDAYPIVCPHCGELWDTAPHSFEDYPDGAESKCENDDNEPGRGNCGGRFSLRRVDGGWLTEPLKRPDAPNYGGWSDGDVLAELNRYGHAGAIGDGKWCVWGGALLSLEVRKLRDCWCVLIEQATPCVVSEKRTVTAPELPEAMAAALELWRDLVAQSDPQPEQLPCPHGRPSWRACPHCLGLNSLRDTFTADLGQRSEFGEPFDTDVAGHDPTERMSEAALAERAKCMKVPR